MNYCPSRTDPSRAPGALTIIAALLMTAASPALAQQSAQATDSQPPAAAAADQAFEGQRSEQVLRTQVLLDRAHFSPGVIDGYPGGNTSRAIVAWQRAHGMKQTGKVDSDLLSKLSGSQSGPLLTKYQISADDVKGPFGSLPSGMEAMAKVDSSHYESPAEALAEKFHMSKGLLEALNPNADFGKAGSTIVVASVEDSPIQKEVDRIEVDGQHDSVRAYAADGTLLARFPATVGSADFPSPSGTMKVKAVAPDPRYYFSPEGRSWGPDQKLTIAPGPNNPVGAVWIDLTKEGYGIHGTPDPKLIGKTASHGCVRLTNWDAKLLAAAVHKGATVEFL